MLAIGRALMSDPKLLLLDEPSLGLAPQMVGRIARIIREIHAQGTAVVLVEQNATMALQVADHAVVLEVGPDRAVRPGRRAGRQRRRAAALPGRARRVAGPGGAARRPRPRTHRRDARGR